MLVDLGTELALGENAGAALAVADVADADAVGMANGLAEQGCDCD